jgi:type I restriction enzyme, S subunit
MKRRWKECHLGDAITLQRGFDLPERERAPGNIPIVSSSGVTGFHDTAKVKAPGVVTGRYGTLGEIHYVTQDFWPLNTTLYVKDFKGNHPRYISYFLKTMNFAAQNAAGAVPGVNRNHLHRMGVLVPPVSIQRKIASILSAYDALIENNTRRIAILEAMAQAIYREWFVEFRFPGHEKIKLVDSPLGKIPNDWKWRDLTEHGFVGRGKSRYRPRNESGLYGGPYPFFQTGDIKEARMFLWKYSQTYSEAGLAQSKLWETGTLCITIAANIAETAILARKACFPDSVVGFVPDSAKSDVFYIKMFLDSIKRQMQNVSRGTTQDNLSLEKLLRFQIPTPPFSQLLRFRDVVTPLFDEILVLSKKNDILRSTRDLLLPKLISGQLDVDDLDIEVEEPLVEVEA